MLFRSIDQIDGYDLLADFQQLDLLEYENGPESVLAVQFSKDDGSGGVGRINWMAVGLGKYQWISRKNDSNGRTHENPWTMLELRAVSDSRIHVGQYLQRA